MLSSHRTLAALSMAPWRKGSNLGASQMVKLDVQRARTVATSLLGAYRGAGIFGVKQGEMPENIPPLATDRGDEEHLLLITLTVALDYMRDHDQLWEAAKR